MQTKCKWESESENIENDYYYTLIHMERVSMEYH